MLEYIHELLNHNASRSLLKYALLTKQEKENWDIIANNDFISTLNTSQTHGTVP
jgi:hypothetical protein